MNKYLQTNEIAPLTNNSKPYLTSVEINHEKSKGWMVLDQVRSFDLVRVIRKLGALTATEIQKTKAVIREPYGG